MQKVFLSYAGQDRQAVDQLARELFQQGISYWRDQDKLYTGQRWPKELGEAIAAQDCVLLVWSKQAAESYYVEMEWCTAVALKKTILPCRLDNTSLPPSLASVQTADLRDGTAVSQIITAFQSPKTLSDPLVEAEVITKLAAINTNYPPEVLQSAKATIFDQRQWTVHGDVHYHASGNVQVITSGSDQPDRQSLRVLLDKVKQFWIHGVLRTSLHQVVKLEVGKTMWNEGVEHPWQSLIELPRDDTHHSEMEEPVIDLFEKSGRSLLILGEPGSGKTITLLELAEYLAVRSDADSSQPIPVVLNLATWTKDHKNLVDWLVQELGSKYHVSRQMARIWLKANSLILLFDGLDEVKLENQASCLNAINTYGEEYGTPGIAVCSRYKEYQALSVRLNLSAAVRLLPLTYAQVKNYLIEAGPSFTTVLEMIEKDEALRTLSQSPLVLTIMALAYKDVSPEKGIIGNGVTTEQRRNQLITAYINRMFERKGQAIPGHQRNDVTARLSWLARQMMKASQTVFLIEGLQPSWLNSKRDIVLYYIGSRALGIGLFMAIMPIRLTPPHTTGCR